MDPDDIRARFPGLEPMRSAPTLFRLNGCGVGLYGRRDADAETGTYVKTRCLSFLFLPLLAIDAWRVADAQGGGWYFYGKTRLSDFAASVNKAVLALVVVALGLLAWSAHTSSDEYRAGQTLAAARAARDGGNTREALRSFDEVASGSSRHAEAARAELGKLAAEALARVGPAEAPALLRSLFAIPPAHRPGASDADLVARARALADAAKDSDPRAALALLDLVRPHAGDAAAALQEARVALLEKLLVLAPDDPMPAIELAVLAEEAGEAARARALLEPHADRLGTGEGARILGQIYAGEGRFEDSHKLLFAYAGERLETLHRAMAAHEKTFDVAWRRAGKELNEGAAGDAWYRETEKLKKPEQEARAREWVQERVTHDAAVARSLAAVRGAAAIVPVALDLGIVTLQRAHGLADPEARRKELEAAEKTFLAIGGVAGDSDEYRLSLGQVDYWLGKHAEGKALFDAYLESKGRSADALSEVSGYLREVGDEEQARGLLEEAYAKAQSDEQRWHAAGQRAYAAIDLEDQALWLGRADPNNPEIRAELASTRGHQAQRRGDEPAAAAAFREALAIYEKAPKGQAVLNNAALIEFDLFEVTGDLAVLKRGNARMEEAIALSPGSAVPLVNLAVHLEQQAIYEVVGDAIDQRALGEYGDWDYLRLLYRDAASRAALAARLAANPGIVRALAHLERLRVIAPKNPRHYEVALRIVRFTRDLPALQALRDRVAAVAVDQAAEVKRYAEFMAGKLDEVLRSDYPARQARLSKLLAGPARGATFAAAATSWVGLELTGEALGNKPDGDRLVEVAEAAHRAQPSVETWTTLATVLLRRAAGRAAASEPALRAALERTARSLPDSYALAWQLGRDDGLAARIKGDADVARALALYREMDGAFPEDRSGLEWALYRKLDPAEAARTADVIRRDALGALERDLTIALEPVSASAALNAAWELEALGKDAEASQLLATYAARGVALPQ